MNCPLSSLSAGLNDRFQSGDSNVFNLFERSQSQGVQLKESLMIYHFCIGLRYSHLDVGFSAKLNHRSLTAENMCIIDIPVFKGTTVW